MEDTVDLAERVRQTLATFPEQSLPLTYQQLADSLGLQPPNTIHRVAMALEQLMREDAAAERPFAAALVISRARNGLPAPGFFNLATRLDRYDGPESGDDAVRFHRQQLTAALLERGQGDG